MALKYGKWVDVDLQLRPTKQEFSFTKVAPVQSITDIVLLGFWLMLLPRIFTSSYTTTFFS